jgi:AhpD family alkylhydroperoxidase
VIGMSLATTAPIQAPVRFDVDALLPSFARAMAHLDTVGVKELDRVGIDPALRELVRVRASQLNGCAYCVDVHSRDARQLGESEQRLWAVAVWREAPFFDARERAALELTESVTRLSETHVPDDVYERVSAVLPADDIAALLALIVTINAWNALSLASRAWAPETP